MSAGDDDGAGSLVRPYTVTGGRTGTRHSLAVEALVFTTANGENHAEGDTVGRVPEAQAICGLCQECRSVAEIAAHLGVPLGVARVLVEDVAEEGLVQVYQPASERGEQGEQGRPDRAVLERVLGGLREL